jgi:sterol desaturase/sphingolipid hydroxylase (fatty acid hydroxylase superfamily)
MAEALVRLPPQRRDALRAQLTAAIPRWYRPWLHLGFPSLVGLGVTAACLAALRDLRGWQLLTLPATWLLLNAVEWQIHKDLLHRRTPPLALLYDRHTPQHHMIFVTDDMAMRSVREFRLVLIPFWGILAAGLGALPIPLVLWAALGARNVALLFMAMTMAYLVSYEWLHLSYHAPADSWVGRRALVAWLRRHHARHHAPERMQRWNFNVTVPLWDWVRGTYQRDEG